jgi:hypothetical protein
MLAALPRDVREQARSAYQLFRFNPHHPSLHFKRLSTRDFVLSVRVGLYYRAVGVQRESGSVLWFWIGPHEAYETIIANRKR